MHAAVILPLPHHQAIAGDCWQAHLARPQKAGSSCVRKCSISLKKPSMLPSASASANSRLPAASTARAHLSREIRVQIPKIPTCGPRGEHAGRMWHAFWAGERRGRRAGAAPACRTSVSRPCPEPASARLPGQPLTAALLLRPMQGWAAWGH